MSRTSVPVRAAASARPARHRRDAIRQGEPARDVEQRPPPDLDVADALGGLRLDELGGDPLERLRVLHQRDRAGRTRGGAPPGRRAGHRGDERGPHRRRRPVARRRPASARAPAPSRSGASRRDGGGARPWASRARSEASRAAAAARSGRHDPMLRCPAMTRPLQRAVLAVVWLLIVAVVSVGGAGLVAAMANQPAHGGPSRADGRRRRGRSGRPRRRPQRELADLDERGRAPRRARPRRPDRARRRRDFTTLDAAVTDGADPRPRRSTPARPGSGSELRLLPGTGPNEALVWSPETIHRRDLALAAVQSTGGLEVALGPARRRLDRRQPADDPADRPTTRPPARPSSRAGHGSTPPRSRPSPQAQAKLDRGEGAPRRLAEHGRRHDADPVDRPERRIRHGARASCTRPRSTRKGKVTQELKDAALARAQGARPPAVEHDAAS